MSASEVSELSHSELESSIASSYHMKKIAKTFLDKGNKQILLHLAINFKFPCNDIIHLRQHSNLLIEASPRLKNCENSSTKYLLYDYIRSGTLQEELRL
jgi:hypothetical protein